MSTTSSSAEKIITVEGPWHTPAPAWSPGWDGVGDINDGWGDPAHPERFDETWVTPQWFWADGFGEGSDDMSGPSPHDSRILFGWNFYNLSWVVFDVNRHVENYLIPKFDPGSQFLFGGSWLMDWDPGYENLPAYDVETSAAVGTPLGPIEIYFRGTVTWTVDPNAGVVAHPEITVQQRVDAASGVVYNVHELTAADYDYTNYANFDAVTYSYLQWRAETGARTAGSTVIPTRPSRAAVAAYALDGTIPAVLSAPSTGDLNGSRDFTYSVSRSLGDEDANGCLAFMIASANYENDTDIPDIGTFSGFFPDEPEYGSDMIIDTHTMRMYYQPPDYRVKYYDLLGIWVDYVDGASSFVVGEHARLYVEPTSYGDRVVVVDWGDGSVGHFPIADYNEPPVVGHTYKKPGTYVVTVTTQTHFGSVSTTINLGIRSHPGSAQPRHPAKATFTPRLGSGPSTLSSPDDVAFDDSDLGRFDSAQRTSGSFFE